MKPEFKAGKNIAVKVPTHEFAKTVAFYHEILGFEQIPGSHDDAGSVAFKFGDKNLWIDSCPGISQAEIWLEINTDDIEAASAYLKGRGCVTRNEIEPLPDDLKGFWVSSPANIIHLVAE